MGILDAIISTKNTETLKQFKPSEIVRDVLDLLKDREKQILQNRYGLAGNKIITLAAIGKQHNLTRERVRQIEKDIIKNLRKNSSKVASFNATKDFLLNIINEHGRIIAEENLFLHLNLKDEVEKNSIIFLLHLVEELEYFINQNYKKSWVAVLFDENILHKAVETGKNILSQNNQPLKSEEFLEHFKKTEFYLEHQEKLPDKVLLNFLHLAIEIEKNVYGHWGIKSWKEIRPKDVGDKAFLVMKYHKQPEHYSKITDMINEAKFDERVAYKETVHNELIKDSRFILIGRGIYALSEWGFKPGVVADVIIEVLKKAGKPMEKDQIISEVMKKRMVKKNTILVGLSNKALFKKVGKNSYTFQAV